MSICKESRVQRQGVGSRAPAAQGGRPRGAIWAGVSGGAPLLRHPRPCLAPYAAVRASVERDKQVTSSDERQKGTGPDVKQKVTSPAPLRVHLLWRERLGRGGAGGGPPLRLRPPQPCPAPCASVRASAVERQVNIERLFNSGAVS